MKHFIVGGTRKVFCGIGYDPGMVSPDAKDIVRHLHRKFMSIIGWAPPHSKGVC
jgi:hypothetical protein